MKFNLLQSHYLFHMAQFGKSKGMRKANATITGLILLFVGSGIGMMAFMDGSFKDVFSFTAGMPGRLVGKVLGLALLLIIYPSLMIVSKRNHEKWLNNYQTLSDVEKVHVIKKGKAFVNIVTIISMLPVAYFLYMVFQKA